MAWPTTNMNELGDQGFYDPYDMVEPSYPQALQPPSMALNNNWTWMGSAPPSSSSPWSAMSSSQAMPNVGGVFDRDMSSSTNTLDTIETGFEIPAHNPSLDQFTGVAATSLLPTYWNSSGGSSTNSGQVSCEENTGSDEISHRALPAQPFADLRNTRKVIRKSRKVHDRPSAEPLQCKWDGCHFSGSFKRESLLIRHLKNIHFSPGSYPCPVEGCDKVCNRADNLTQHTRNVHR